MVKKIAALIAVILMCFEKNVYAMHISEGILPLKWAALWYAIALPFLIVAVSKIKKKSASMPHFKPMLAFMGALIFVISCLPVPIPTAGTCSHPAGTGISAILVGPLMSVFVTSIALLIQALFLAHGGITTWGADIVSMGIAGSFAAYFIFIVLRRCKVSLFFCGFFAGVFADWATYAMTSFELASALHGSESLWKLFAAIAIAFVPTQLPLGILEGFMTGGMLVFVARRRPDILAALGIKVDKKTKGLKKNAKVIAIVLLVAASLAGMQSSKALASDKTPPLKESGGSISVDKWSGVDVSIIEKVAREHGREAWTPFINTDQGDLLLFVFLLAGTAGGFVMGLYWQKLFSKKEDACDGKRSI